MKKVSENQKQMTRKKDKVLGQFLWYNVIINTES